MDCIADGRTTQVVTMARFQQHHPHRHDDEPAALAYEDDLTMEQILDNINHTPIGQVLSRIASLPQARRNKVLDVRRSLSQGRYEINTRLDQAIERVFEDLKT
jgi:hypothetical protein